MMIAYQFKLFLSKENQLALNALSSNRALLALPFSTPRVTPRLDITLVTFNSAKWLDGFFETLSSQDYPLSCIALYVVDHDSDDDTLVRLRDWSTRLVGLLASFDIYARDNLGFGAGQNFAIARGTSDFVLVVNPDIKFEADALTAVVSLAAADLPFIASWELRQKPYEHPKHYDPVTWETNWSSHASILLRRSAWQAVGGYDERIFLYAEDVDLSYRLRRAGYHLRYCPKAVVWHFSYAQPSEIKPTQYVGSIVGNLILRLRYGSRINKVAGFVLLCFRVLATQPIPHGRRRLLKMLIRSLRPGKSMPLLPVGELSAKVHLGFWGFDYELRREGAFVAQRKIRLNCPLISVITRTLGTRPKLLLEAGRSVMNQSYPNIEWLVIEDGGERMKAIIQDFADRTPRPVRYLPLPRLGRSAAGNEGLRCAQGTHCIFLDDDDLLYADHIESLWATLEQDSGCVAAYALSFAVHTRYRSENDSEDVFISLPSYLEQPFSYDILHNHNYIPIQAILFPRSLFVERGGFNEELEFLEDWNLWLRYAYRNRFAYLPKVTSLFRLPTESEARLSRQQKLDGAIREASEAAEAWCRHYDVISASSRSSAYSAPN